MSVVKFPRVIKTIDEMTPEELKQQFDRTFGDLPPMSKEESAKWHEQMAEEFYYEDAEQAINQFWILSCAYRDAAIGKYTENSAEASAVKEDIAFVGTTLRKLRNNLDHPDVKKAVKSLSEVWAEYKGKYYDEKGDLQWRNKPIGAEIIPALRRAANFDL